MNNYGREDIVSTILLNILRSSYITMRTVGHETREKCQGCSIVTWNGRAIFVRPGGFFIADVASPVTVGNARNASHDDGDAE